MSFLGSEITFIRMQKILSAPEIAHYRAPRNHFVNLLNDYFWDEAGGLNGFWNKRIYKKQITVLSEALTRAENPHTIESVRNNLADILNNRTDEFLQNLIDANCLGYNETYPVEYYPKISPLMAILKQLFRIKV